MVVRRQEQHLGEAGELVVGAVGVSGLGGPRKDWEGATYQV